MPSKTVLELVENAKKWGYTERETLDMYLIVFELMFGGKKLKLKTLEDVAHATQLSLEYVKTIWRKMRHRHLVTPKLQVRVSKDFLQCPDVELLMMGVVYEGLVERCEG